MDALITKVGVQAMLNAQQAGTVLSLSQIKISSTVIEPTGDETSLSSIVYTVLSNQIQKSIEGTTLIFKIRLDVTVGPFSIGTFGIYTSDNILFAVASFPGSGAKVKSVLPATLGNDKTFYLMIKYDDLETTVNVTIGDPMANVLAPAGFPDGGTTVTARQMRLALAGNLQTVVTAVAALAITNAVRIGWDTTSPVTKGDVVSEFIKTTLSYSSGQHDALFASAAIQTP